jgi:hypothetical protein
LVFFLIIPIEGVEFFTASTAYLERFPSDKVDGVPFNLFKGYVFNNLLQILGRQLYELEGATLLRLP